MRDAPEVAMDSPSLRDRFRGCLLGGALGDALGAPVEFMARGEIDRRFGPAGVLELAEAYGRVGAVTDDTQMTLFTAEGLIRAYVRWLGKGICHVPSVVANAYRRWLWTQDGAPTSTSGTGGGASGDGWLIGVPALHQRRAPGNTCLAALRGMQSPGQPAENQSKGCGGVMRMAPVGMFVAGGSVSGARGSLNQAPFDLGVELAALTHGHPTGQLASGLFADIVARLLAEIPLPDAVEQGLVELRKHPQHEETSMLVELACELAQQPADRSRLPDALGQGWVAEEALALGLYAALVSADPESGLRLAVNHSGDSDSTGSIAGNLLGAIHGQQGLPARWLTALELREEITRMADDLLDVWHWDLDEDEQATQHRQRYPGV
jgi:ADP-ribosylglycohydrolase